VHIAPKGQQNPQTPFRQRESSTHGCSQTNNKKIKKEEKIIQMTFFILFVSALALFQILISSFLAFFILLFIHYEHQAHE
jgi:hypothetical protein